MAENKLSSSLEDYLEAIYWQCQEKSFAQANKIAESLDVGKSSVSWALNHLSQKDLINYKPYEPITLTDKGFNIAKRIASRHQDIKDFLTDVLAINENVAEENACRLEHVIDHGVMRRMKQFWTFLQECPRLGTDWIKGFGYFCDHGRNHDTCRQCITECLDQIQPAIDEQADIELPKQSKNRDRNVVKYLREILKESGRPFSSQQQIIAEMFMRTEKHQTVKDIHKAVRKNNPEITTKLIEDTLQLLCEHKIANMLRFRDQIVYEHFHPESHHDHLFCVKCGAIVEFFDPRLEALQVENARRADFRLLQHNLNIFGVCHECIKRESKTRLLNECLAGEHIRVTQIVADSETQKRIGQMGLAPGTTVEILSNDCCGDSMIVIAGDTRLMLDPGIANKIKVVATVGDMELPDLGFRRRRRRHRHIPDRTD